MLKFSLVLVCIAAFGATFSIDANHFSVDATTQQLEAKGSVNVSGREIQATSNRVVYHIESKKVEFFGETELQQGEDYLKGPYLMVNLDQKALVSKGRTKLNLSVETLND